MAEGDQEQGDSPEEASGLPTGGEELDRLEASPLPVIPVTDLSEVHRERYIEAFVSQVETGAQRAEDDRKLREKIAERVSWAAGIQVAVADLVFLIYGTCNDWHIPGSTMTAWLGATVIQVIAVALVIVKSLFPEKQKPS